MKRVLVNAPLFQQHRIISRSITTGRLLANAETSIKIPKRIPRGSTDILKALASTVKTDPTAPHYKFVDDPFLIPEANIDKRTFALSRESGKKAAKYFLQNFPDFFVNNPAVPNIPAFNADERKYTEDQEYNLEDLTACLEKQHVGNAEIVYRSLESKGVEIPDETLLLLLQLCSFYNSTQPIDNDLPEEKSYSKLQNAARKSWADGGLAEQIFEKIGDKDARAYSSLIQGMLKHFQLDRAFSLYQEMQEKGLVPSVHTYNYLLLRLIKYREGGQARWEYTQEILNNMAANGVKPNLATFNNLLFICSRLGLTNNSKNNCLSVLAEMKSLGIKPSLATYERLLSIFHFHQQYDGSLLSEILDSIENEPCVYRDPNDTYFLHRAMEVASNLADKDLGFRIHKFAESNYHMIGDAFQESVYFSNFFKLLVATEEIDKFMEAYRKFVPNSYTPEPNAFVEILEAVKSNGAVRYASLLWSDIVAFRHLERENILSLLTSLIASASTTDRVLIQQCDTIAAELVRRIDENNARREKLFRTPLAFTGQMASDLLTTFVKSSNLEMAKDIFRRISITNSLIIGVPEKEALETFANFVIAKNEPQIALDCATYCSDIGYSDVVSVIRQLLEENHFGGEFLEKIDSLSSTTSA